MTNHHIIDVANLTLYKDVNLILSAVSCGVTDVLLENLIGLYLFGSLSYGDFNVGSSDVDLVVIVRTPLNAHELDGIKKLHERVGEMHPTWRDRVECSYTPLAMLQEIAPPKQPRPYYGDGVFYDAAPYGNEWIINNYLLYQHSIALIGDNFKTLIEPIDIVEVQKACIRDLFQEWEPKITDYEWLDSSHYQSYVVLNLCRILYTVMCGAAGSKKVSAAWVKNQFGVWRQLIEAAERWEHGKGMAMRDKTVEFIKFVITQIKSTGLYQKMYFNES